MNISARRTLFASAMLFFALANESFATESTVVLNLEGNPTCKSLSDNSVIKEARDTSPTASVNTDDIATGTDGQKITYQLTSKTTTRDSVKVWTNTSPVASVQKKAIKFVILKAKDKPGARVYYYSGPGLVTDTDLQATGAISSVSFCYDDDDHYPSPSAGNLPDCGTLTNGPVCPSSPDERVLISLDPNAANWNVTACSCNHTFKACNPNATFDPVTDPTNASHACPSGQTLPRVPVMIEAVEDPFYCTTVGGTRTCKSY